MAIETIGFNEEDVIVKGCFLWTDLFFVYDGLCSPPFFVVAGVVRMSYPRRATLIDFMIGNGTIANRTLFFVGSTGIRSVYCSRGLN